MNKKSLIVIICCCFFTAAFFTQEEALKIDFYDVTFLRNSPAVQKVLKVDGFFEIDFKTQDNLMINAIMLDQSRDRKVTATMISCPGFVPGNKEGMTTLYAMLKDQPYNFIFIDSRGHGKSDGELLTYNGIKHYGESQYLDIVATIEFVMNYNAQHNIKSDIILHGLCAGAFHTTKAVAHLKQSNPQAYNCVKGIIFDSGWPVISDIAESVVTAESGVRCESYNVPYLEPYLAYIMLNTYRYLFKEQHETQTPITKAIGEIDQPILFIHAENDLFVPIHHIYPLVTTAKKPVSWFIKESSHVNNHLKYKEEYAAKMERFIQAALQ